MNNSFLKVMKAAVIYCISEAALSKNLQPSVQLNN
jgi:hypothetical protein